ncbi:hypothetical protein J4Q44_G00235540 [Coregonus suidteri]|uniref:Uncharacterized protein n=1 Tax=Coregonus suidteri TaxID=861788 RepID=A0AAN8LCH8_9TELE
MTPPSEWEWTTSRTTWLQLGDGTSSSDEEDFFSAMKTSQAQESSKQLDGYLACSADHMELLKSFPAV